MPGSRVNASVAGYPCGSLRGHTPWSSRGGAGEGPGRENSLASLSASLTNSLSHPRREVSPSRSSNYCELTAVTVFGLITAASACRRGDNHRQDTHGVTCHGDGTTGLPLGRDHLGVMGCVLIVV